MTKLNVSSILKRVEQLPAKAGDLPPEAEQVVEKLLNVVETLSADRKDLADEVKRLRKQLEQKKQARRRL